MTLGAEPAGFSYNASTHVWTLDTGAMAGFTALANGTHDVGVRVTAGGVSKNDVSTGELQVNTTPPTLTLASVAGDNTINGNEDGQAVLLTGSTDAAVGSTVSALLNGQTYTGQCRRAHRAAAQATLSASPCLPTWWTG